MSRFPADLRYAFRVLRRDPAFTAVAIATLALGIGANTTMFSVVNATLLRPLPFPDADRLVFVWQGKVDDPKNLNIVSLPNFRDWRSESRAFASMALFDSAGRGYNLSGGAEPEQVSGVRVTASFFTALGVPPLLGRTFRPEEEEPGNDREVVLSHGLWKRRYGGDPELVGKTVTIDGEAFTVVGVMPPGFQFQFWSGPRQLWVPAGYTRGDQDRGSNSFVCFARLAPSATLAEARAEMDQIHRALSAAYPNTNAGQTARVVPMAEYGMGELRSVLLALFGIVGFVLLIACVNVANLMLARAAARQKELAVRSALGATRARILRQLLSESLVLALLGGAAGIALALAITRLLPFVLPGDLRFLPMRPVETIGIDLRVLAFTFAVCLVTGILFGLVPALAALREDLGSPLKDNARGSTAGGRGRLRHALVASETALTLLVLGGAGLMIASVARLLGVSPGLDPRNVLVMAMSLPQEDLYYGPPTHARFCEALDEHVGGLPGVLSASAIAHLPLSGGGAGRGLAIEGQPDPGPEKQPGAGYSVACPGYLRTLGIPLLAGREFTAADRVGAPGVVIVNEAMAKRFWPGEDAVGKRFKIGMPGSDDPWLTVVGVSANVRHWGLDEDISASFLRPYSQAGWPVMSIVVKTASAPAGFVPAVKKALRDIEPLQPVSSVQTMEDVLDGSVSRRRFPMMLLVAFALVALALAAVGIAGVVSYSVVQRTPEIGIRMALGAARKDVLALVVGGSMRWAMGGVLAGLVACFGLLRFMAALLYGVAATDPTVLASVSALLVAVAFAASYLPARRAARVDPAIALRSN
jgi:predicted permease